MSHPDSRDSSPDPLTQSWNTSLAIRPLSSPSKRRFLGSNQKQQASATNRVQSPQYQPSFHHQQTLIFSTPTKMRSTGDSGLTSPWRIKVTVQAEQEHPANDRPDLLPNTTTTKVPLKPADDHTPARRRSKRARSSAVQPPDEEEQERTTSSRKRRTLDTPASQPRSLRKRVPTPKRPATSTTSYHNKSGHPASNDSEHDHYDDDSAFNVQDDTSVLDRSLAESEGFSMVSIDSLRSHREQAEREAAAAAAEIPETRNDSQSSAPTSGNSKHVLSSTTKNGSRRGKGKKSKQSPFTAFGTDTKRLLSADLALGEMLAQEDSVLATKYPHASGQNARLPSPPETASLSSSRGSQEPETTHESATIVTKSESRSKQPESREVIPPIRNDPDLMSWRQTTPPQTVPSNQQTSAEVPDIHQTALEAANDIVFNPRDRNSGPEDSAPVEAVDIAEDFTGSADIWQEEADRSMDGSINSQPTRARNMAREAENYDTPDLNEVLGEDDRPLRAKIPRAWRKSSGQGFLYGDEAVSPAPNPPAASQLPEFNQSDIHLPKKRLSGLSNNTSLKPMPKSILSSPARREQQQNYTPKEVRFQNKSNSADPTSITPGDEIYFSSEHLEESAISLSQEESLWGNQSSPLANRSSPGDAQPLSSGSRKRGASDTQRGYLQQLKAELIAMATPRGRELLHAPNDPNEIPEKEMQAQSSDPEPEPEPEPLEEESQDESEYDAHYVEERPKEDPNFDKHVLHAESITIVLSQDNQRQSVLSRLSSWLYPSPPAEHTYTYTWNRNHYLVLHHLWCKVFQSPDFITPKEYSQSAHRRMLDSLPSGLKRYVGARITRYNGQTPLNVTLEHCYVAGQFITDARDKGIPLLCDGRSKPCQEPNASSNLDGRVNTDGAKQSLNANDELDWPKRDSAGRIIRIRQDWTAEETLKAVYSLWLIKMSHARTSKLVAKRKGKAASPGRGGC